MKKFSLVKSFTLSSFFTFIVAGIFLTLGISEHITNQYQKQLISVAQIAVDEITENILSESEFNTKITEKQKLSIEESINKSLNLFTPRSFTFYNNTKQIILSNRLPEEVVQGEELIGIDKILMNEATYYISKVYTVDDINKTKVFDVYIPVVNLDIITGVFVFQIPEVYISYHVNMLVKQIVLTMIGGLSILFLLLTRQLHSASKTLIEQNNELIKQKAEIENAFKMLTDSYRNTIIALSNAVDARDSYTAGHSERVAKISLLIGNQLGIKEEDLKILEYAALFHDIGKIGIPDYILLKNSKLTEAEFAVIKNHPDMGVNILKSIRFLDKTLPIIKHHHERYIGGGYPDNLTRDEIPFSSRIISLADTYDAMTTNRPYRKKFTHEAAVKEILRNRQVQFDAVIVDAFMSIEKNIGLLGTSDADVKIEVQ